MFVSIKEWEIGHFNQDMQSGMNKQNYIKDLETKRLKFINDFENLPQSIANKHRRWRIAADIEQLKWRLDYLK